MDAKWDWYKIGGRWDGTIPRRNGAQTNYATKGEVDWAKFYTDRDNHAPYAIVHGGEWSSRGEMGWFGFSDDVESAEDWRDSFEEIIDTLDKNDLLVAVDLHI